MKLSDFTKDRELEFYMDKEGKEATRIIEPLTKGRIKFHSINKGLLDKLNSADIKKEKQYDERVYRLIDILTNVKKDIELEQFKSMLAYPPNNAFIKFITEINREFIDLMNRFTEFKESIDKVNKELDKNIAKLPEDIKQKVVEIQMSDEELLSKLKKEYDIAETQEIKEEILDKIVEIKTRIKNK